MIAITLAAYYMGRDRTYGAELTGAYKISAGITIDRINALLLAAEADGIVLHLHPVNKTLLSSGWRPAAVNKATPGAAIFSKHTTCQAGDVYDPVGDLDEWALARPQLLEKLELWQEHPSATKGWAHFQTVAPRSGNRVFYP
jgi:hypothetical protein